MTAFPGTAIGNRRWRPRVPRCPVPIRPTPGRAPRRCCRTARVLPVRRLRGARKPGTERRGQGRRRLRRPSQVRAVPPGPAGIAPASAAGLLGAEHTRSDDRPVGSEGSLARDFGRTGSSLPPRPGDAVTGRRSNGRLSTRRLSTRRLSGRRLCVRGGRVPRSPGCGRRYPTRASSPPGRRSTRPSSSSVRRS